MNYFLTRESVIKWLETPAVYHIKKDELYELDYDSFEFLKGCSTDSGCSTEDREFLEYCISEGIATRDIVKTRRPDIIKSPVPSLRYLELQITDRCNLRCGHCYISDGPGRELSPVQIRDILSEFEGMQGLRLLITGGEPLAHSRFNEINAMLPEFSIRKVLFTNGLLLNAGVIKKLKIDELQVSIDGMQDAHDSLRGKGSFKRALEALRLSIRNGIETSVSTMVHSQNLGDFDKMDKLFKAIGIKDWTVDVPCITGRLKKNTGFHVTPEVAGRYLAYGYGNGLHSSAPGFACGLHLMSVTADGKASKCTFYSDRAVGNIEEGLMKNWHKIRHVRLDELKCDCNKLEMCRGGCRYRAELLGDRLGKDLYRCFFVIQ